MTTSEDESGDFSNVPGERLTENLAKVFHRLVVGLIDAKHLRGSPIKEDTYTSFINAYKEGLGTEGFDITEHFNQRKKATLTRSENYWFEIHQTL